MTATFAVIAGGGTAGHVLPGVAIAQELATRGHPNASVLFVGSARGVERDLVPDAGFEVVLLPGRGIQRRLTTANLGAVWGLMKAFGRAWSLLRRRRPSVVVSMGGYASVPCGVAAALRRVPIVVAEQNAVPGLANRLIGRFAKTNAVAFDGTELPRRVVTGNPVRSEVLAMDRSPSGRREAKLRFGVDGDRRLVLVFGGSLGARRINEAVLDALGDLSHRSDLAIRHVVGERDHPDLRQRIPTATDWQLQYEMVEYEPDMAGALTAADLVLCRAGATSIAELAIAGVPSILVPLPGAPGDHQTANARAMVEAGAAVLIPDAELSSGRVVTVVGDLLADGAALAERGRRAGALGRRDAAARVADLIEAAAE